MYQNQSQRYIIMHSYLHKCQAKLVWNALCAGDKAISRVRRDGMTEDCRIKEPLE